MDGQQPGHFGGVCSQLEWTALLLQEVHVGRPKCPLAVQGTRFSLVYSRQQDRHLPCEHFADTGLPEQYWHLT
eukprot:m.385068 g.385068  ORF g.385068 m.385068 type:complete len:73 (+) comp20050_c8_seq7:430-648(+)